MVDTLPRQPSVAGLRAGRMVTIAAALLAGVLTAAAAVLWLRHGTAVFLHTIMAGIAACL